jgi:hypothetical protein
VSRILKVTALLLALAFGASAVALAVERPGRQEDERAEQPERVATVTGVLTADGKRYSIAGRELGLGPPRWRDSGKAADFDGDGTFETVAAELQSLKGKSVTVTGEADDESELGVRTIAGKAFREQGRPPWAGGPDRGDRGACKAKKQQAKAAAKARGKGGEHGPPPWAKARGRCS